MVGCSRSFFLMPRIVIQTMRLEDERGEEAARAGESS